MSKMEPHGDGVGSLQLLLWLGENLDHRLSRAQACPERAETCSERGSPNRLRYRDPLRVVERSMSDNPAALRLSRGRYRAEEQSSSTQQFVRVARSVDSDHLRGWVRVRRHLCLVEHLGKSLVLTIALLLTSKVVGNKRPSLLEVARCIRLATDPGTRPFEPSGRI